MFIPTRGLVVVILAGLLEPLAAQDLYRLQVPGRNDLTSQASLSGQQLVITDSQNQTFTYQRVRQLDSPDGNYAGFYSQAAGQAIRWPINGGNNMLIGDANGRNWRQSRQQIQPMRQAVPQQPNIVTTRKPIFNPNVPNPLGNPLENRPGNAGNQNQRRYDGPMQVAYASAGNQTLDVGFIGKGGDLQLFRGYRDSWKPRQLPNVNQVNSARLLPGAPLALVSRQGQQHPSAFTVNSQGRLLEISGSGEVRPIANTLQFAPRSSLHVQAGNQGPEGFAVDAQGRLWDLDLANGQHHLIDQQAGRFSPGVPIATVVSPNNSGGQNDLFLVDQQGQVLQYTRGPGQWNQPRTVAAGFPPGAPIAATTISIGGQLQFRLAGVDARGNVQTLGQTRGRWQAFPIREVTMPPGSPLVFTTRGSQLSLSGVGPGGVWNHWAYHSGQWNQSTLSRGFLAGSPVVADPLSQTVFGVDATGRLLANGYWDQAWHPHLLIPGLDYAPTLVRRRIVPNRGLAPATVFFDNPSPEELVVQMVDQSRPGAPIQFNIPPNGSTAQQIRRDGGGTLEEVYLVPGPFGELIESVDSFPLPPQPGPTVVAWSKRVTYRYIDKKHVSVLPDFDLKTHVSLGVFDLPPGEFLRTGDRFDVFREAASRQNPGAAQYFGPPIPDADVNVPLYRNPQPRNRVSSTPNSGPALIPPAPTNPTQDPNPQQGGPVLPPLPR